MASHAAVCQSDRDLAQFRLIGMSQTIISNVYLLLASDNQVQHTLNINLHTTGCCWPLITRCNTPLTTNLHTTG